MSNGLYFYKLVSPYEEDVTKNCKLTVNEIDSNFLNLKDMDIKSMDFNEDTNILTLTRNNGDILQVDLSSMISGITRDFDVSFDDCEGKLTFTYNDIVKTISGFVTEKTLGDYIMTEAITDGTVIGNGRDEAPLGLNPVEQTGFYRPVIDLIDTTIGEELPTCNNNGDRYLTYEQVDDYGHLYNYAGIEQIAKILEDTKSPWRIPTKADWDLMLNAIEPCAYRNHNSIDCHIELGKLAGKKLKSADKWACDSSTSGYTCEVDYLYDDIVPEEKPFSTVGSDDYGFTAYPGGYGVDKNHNVVYFGEHASFWSSTQTFPGVRSDYYVKTLTYDSSGVWQSAECPDNYYSLRLVKDYTGSNARETEYIGGKYYPTILMPAMPDYDGGKNLHKHSLWTAVNVDLGKNEGVSEENYIRYADYGDLYDTSKQRVYVINHWTGTSWERKRLVEGDTVVINNAQIHMEDIDGNYVDYDKDTEFRVMKIDGELRLIATDDVVYKRVLIKIMPIITELDAKLDKEISERIEADEILSGAIETEKEERIEMDEFLSGAIETEKEDRIAADEFLSGAIDTEREERVAADEFLSGAIDTEREERIAADEFLSGAIDTEREERIAADEFLSGAIDTEREERIAADDALSGAIDTEREERIAADNEIWANLISGGTVDLSAEDDPISKNGIEKITLHTYAEGSGDTSHNMVIYLNGNYGEF